MKDVSRIKIVSENKKARHDYFIEQIFEAGIVLTGTEIKSIRRGGLNLKDSYCTLKNNELFLIGAHISPYENGNRYNVDPKRDRKLLVHRKEIDKLRGAVDKKGYTLVVTKGYLKGGLFKVEVAIAKGKELHDKRAALKEKDENRQIQKYLKQINK